MMSEKNDTKNKIIKRIESLLDYCKNRDLDVIGTLIFSFDDELYVEKIDTTVTTP